jgi:hypothetical protein
MSIIQLALTAGVIIIGLYMYLRLRSTLFDVLLILLFIGAGIFLILFPDYANRIAHWAGVGRGADLMFYLGILFLFFLILKLYARLRRIEQNFTELVRKKSIEEGEDIAKKNS